MEAKGEKPHLRSIARRHRTALGQLRVARARLVRFSLREKGAGGEWNANGGNEAPLAAPEAWGGKLRDVDWQAFGSC